MTAQNKRLSRPMLTAFALAGLGLMGSAQAATWDFSSCSGTIATKENWGSCGTSNTSTDVDIRGYNSTVAAVSGTQVKAWSGSGIGYYADGSDTTNGAHAVDNAGGVDALVLKFSDLVSLTSFQVGWNGSDKPTGTWTDSDASVYYWAGTGAPSITSGSGLTFSSSAWQLVSHYSNVGKKTNNTAAISTAASSSYWLISAYNGTTWTTGDDAFKLLSVAGTIRTTPSGNGVPEPGSLALLGLGAAGLLAARRKATAQR